MKEQDWMLAWVNLAHAGTFLTGQLDKHFRERLGFGLAEQDLIKQVAVNRGQLTMSELAKRLYYSKAGVTKMVDRLQQSGILARRPSPTDRRVIFIELTSQGRSAFDKSRKLLLAFVHEHFRSHLSDNEVHALRCSLRSLLEGLGRYEGQMDHLRGG